MPVSSFVEDKVKELQSIQESTELLAEKERELRRQLKKLKKLYVEKVEELNYQQATMT